MKATGGNSVERALDDDEVAGPHDHHGERADLGESSVRRSDLGAGVGGTAGNAARGGRGARDLDVTLPSQKTAPARPARLSGAEEEP